MAGRPRDFTKTKNMSSNSHQVTSSSLFLIRFVQGHVSFRLAELQALSELEKVPVEVVEYSDDNPFCIVSIASAEDARRLVTRSILSKAIWEFLAEETSYEALHAYLRHNISREAHTLENGSHNQRNKKIDWQGHKSWKFSVDCYLGKKTMAQQRAIIETFSYIPLTGPINLKTPDQEFRVFEEYPHHLATTLKRVFLTRHVGNTSRDLMMRYDLKKRCYISTTSMDSELALVTANLALADRGKIMYDPFAGTGGFMISCAEFGAQVWGSDIDSRTLRGKQEGKNVFGNFTSYGLESQFGDLVICDLTNSPIRLDKEWLDGIVCDPPYGVREGLWVLGLRPGKEFRDQNGEIIRQQRHEEKDFIPPRRPYSFLRLLDDILWFASQALVEGGRLSMWIPSENSEAETKVEMSTSDKEGAEAGTGRGGSSEAAETAPTASTAAAPPTASLELPSHPALEVVSVCTQEFNHWSRRLVTYRKLKAGNYDPARVAEWDALRLEKGKVEREEREGKKVVTADELNSFRKRYFEGFRKDVS